MSRFPGIPGRGNNSSNFVRPLSIYNNLTQEEKQFYADVLNSIFLGTIGNVQASQVTPKIARAADFFIAQIVNCSKAIVEALKKLVLGPAFSAIYDAVLQDNVKYQNYPFAKRFIIKRVSSWAFGQLIDYIFKDKIFSGCVSAVNVRWKSYMGLLLYGVIDDLPY